MRLTHYSLFALLFSAVNMRAGMRLFHMYEHYTVGDERLVVLEYVEGKRKENFYMEAAIALRFRYDEE